VEYTQIFVDILRFVWFQTRSKRFITPAASPIRGMYSEVELLLLDWMLPRYVNSCTGSTVLPFTVTGDGAGPQMKHIQQELMYMDEEL